MPRRSPMKTLLLLIAAGVIIIAAVAFFLFPLGLKGGSGSADIEKSPSGEVWARSLDGGWMVHKSTYEGFSSREDALNGSSNGSAIPASYSTWQFDDNNRHVSTESNEPRGAGYVMSDYRFDDNGSPVSIEKKMLGEGDATTGWVEELVEYQPSFGTGWYDTWTTYTQPSHTCIATQSVRFTDGRTQSLATYLGDRVIKQVQMEYEDYGSGAPRSGAPLTSITVLDDAGTIGWSASSYYEYGTDDQGQWMKEYKGPSSPDATTGEIVPHVRSLKRFNDEGAVVLEQDFKKDDSLFRETVYTYDDTGTLVRETSDYTYGAQSSTDYFYNGPDGLLSCVLTQSDEGVFSVTTYDYKGTPPAQASICVSRKIPIVCIGKGNRVATVSKEKSFRSTISSGRDAASALAMRV